MSPSSLGTIKLSAPRRRCSSLFGPGVRVCQTRCADGFFARSGECIQCNSSGSKCSVRAELCLECAPGYFIKNHSCVKDRGIGYFFDSVRCQLCDPNCADCEGNSKNCTSCPLPLYGEGTKCVENCTSGYKPSSTPLVRLADGRTLLEGRVEVSNSMLHLLLVSPPNVSLKGQCYTSFAVFRS